MADLRISFLRSGRIVVDTIRDSEGRPLFIDTIDSRTNQRALIRGAGWDISDRSRSYGPAINETEVPEVIEFYLDVHQTFWKWPNPQKKTLISFPNAFPWCEPRAGDQLMSNDADRKVYTVKAVIKPAQDQLGWALQVLLDSAPEIHRDLVWIGKETRSRTLVRFKAEDSSAASVTNPADSGGDVGVGYPNRMPPTITYLLETQRPGSIGAAPFGQSKQLKPRHREMLRDPITPQESLAVSGWWMDNIWKFEALHSRSIVADQLAYWFKRFMQVNIPSLKASGINEILYWSQDPEERRSTGDDAARRLVRYYFRTEEIEIRRISNLRNINVIMTTNINARPYPVAHGEWEAMDPFTGDLRDESGGYTFGNLQLADTRTTGTLL